MLDGDLQHPPELIPKMLELWANGYDIVYTRRKEDRRLSLYKRMTSSLFHRILRSMSGMHIEQGIADFRLLDRKVLDVLASFHEPDLFLRGIVQWMGYRSFGLDYMPEQRFTGQTKYNSIKLIKHAVQGITSFSVKPLYIAIFLGLLFVALSMSYMIYVLWRAALGLGASGWASTIITIMFFGGLNMLLLGIIGVYVGKIFIQTKRRPTYIVREMN
jgi:dolichol-phosphate mannosyltransferase